MSVIDTQGSFKFSVKPGTQNRLSLTGLRTGTMYAIVARGVREDGTKTSYAAAGTPGSGVALYPKASLPASTAQKVMELEAAPEVALTYGSSFAIAGADLVTVNDGSPLWMVRHDASTAGKVVLDVAYPGWFSATSPNLEKITALVSTDGRLTWEALPAIAFEMLDEKAQRSGDMPPAASFSIIGSKDTNVYVRFQATMKDGTKSPMSKVAVMHASTAPPTIHLNPPTIRAAVGEYADGEIRLKLTLTPDPQATALTAEVWDDSNTKLRDGFVPLTDGWVSGKLLELRGLKRSTKYTIKAFSQRDAVLSLAATKELLYTDIEGSTPIGFLSETIHVTEEITSVDNGTATSRFKVDLQEAVTAEFPLGIVYLRDRDNQPQGTDLSTFTGFERVGQTSTSILTDTLVLSRVYEIFVAAVTADGRESAWDRSACIPKPCVGYGAYLPPVQPPPVLTVDTLGNLVLAGTYLRESGSPVPHRVQLFKSLTDASAPNRIISEPLSLTGSGSLYRWSMSVRDLTPFWDSATGAFYLTLRYELETNTLTPTNRRTVVKVIPQGTAPTPTLTDAKMGVQTVSLTASCPATAPSLTSYNDTFVPNGGGNGASVVMSLGVTGLLFDIRDQGATFPGAFGNAVQVAPASLGHQDDSWFATVFSQVNGYKDVRVQASGATGTSGWSNSLSVRFPEVIDDPWQPDATVCAPRFTANADGTIKLVWKDATFGPSGLGNYTIRRTTFPKTSFQDSEVVGVITDRTLNHSLQGNANFDSYVWTDEIPFKDVNHTSYYYFLQATSGAGKLCPAPSQFLSILDGTTTKVSSVDVAPPAAPTSIKAVGGVGCAVISWDAVPDLDLQHYELEYKTTPGGSTWGAAGKTAATHFDHFITGFSAEASVIAGYRYRVRAVDFGSHASAWVEQASATDTAAYVPLSGARPDAPASATALLGTDSNVAVTIQAPISSASVLGGYRIVRLRANDASGTGSVEDGDQFLAARATGATVVYNDGGLNPKYYYKWQIFSVNLANIPSLASVTTATWILPKDTTAPVFPSGSPMTGTSQVGSKFITVDAPREGGVTVEIYRMAGDVAFNSSTASVVFVGRVPHDQSAAVPCLMKYVDQEPNPSVPTTHSYFVRSIDTSGNATAVVACLPRAITGTKLVVNNPENASATNLIKRGGFRCFRLGEWACAGGYTPVSPYSFFIKPYWFVGSQYAGNSIDYYVITSPTLPFPCDRYAEIRITSASGGNIGGLVVDPSAGGSSEIHAVLAPGVDYILSAYVKTSNGGTPYLTFPGISGIIATAYETNSNPELITASWKRVAVKLRSAAGYSGPLGFGFAGLSNGATYLIQMSGIMLQRGTVLTPFADHPIDLVQDSVTPLIDADSVDRLVADGAIVMGKLVISNFTNMIQNGNSEMDAPATSPEGAGISSNYAYGSTSRSRYVGPSQQVFVTGKLQVPQDAYPIFEAQCLAWDSGYGAYPFIQCCRADNSHITYIDPVSYTQTYGAWTKKSVRVTPQNPLPADTAYIRAGIYGHANGGYCDNLMMRLQNDGKMIVDGSLTANMITTGTLDASTVNVINLNAAHITAGTMSLARLSAGEISADTLRVRDLKFDNLSNSALTMTAGSQAILSNNYQAATGSSASDFTKAKGFRLAATPYYPKVLQGSTVLNNGGATMPIQAEFGANVSVGGYLLGDVTAAALNLFDMKPFNSGAAWRGFYKGMSSGFPNIACLSVRLVQAAPSDDMFVYQFKVKPSAHGAQDNLDALRYIKVEFLRASSPSTVICTQYVPIADRLYVNLDNDADDANASYTTCVVNFDIDIDAIHANRDYLFVKCSLWNAYGRSAEAFYMPPVAFDYHAWVYATDFTSSGTTNPSGGSDGSGGSGGSGGGGGCVPAGALIPTLTGLRRVEDLQVGDQVLGFDDTTWEPVISLIRKTYRYKNRDLWALESDFGSLVCSHDHRIFLNGHWVPARYARLGDRIKWVRDGILEDVVLTSAAPLGRTEDVFHLSMDKGHVYVADNVPAHNKVINVNLMSTD